MTMRFRHIIGPPITDPHAHRAANIASKPSQGATRVLVASIKWHIENSSRPAAAATSLDLCHIVNHFAVSSVGKNSASRWVPDTEIFKECKTVKHSGGYVPDICTRIKFHARQQLIPELSMQRRSHKPQQSNQRHPKRRRYANFSSWKMSETHSPIRFATNFEFALHHGS